MIYDTVLKLLTNTFDFWIIKVDELPVMTDCIMSNVIRSLINISKRTGEGHKVKLGEFTFFKALCVN